MFARRLLFTLLTMTASLHLFARQMESAAKQLKAADTLAPVKLEAYRDQPLSRSPASAAVISSKELNEFSSASLVPVMNTIAGVRMEERSPGSYRLSIRGSLLRSPFGIRNVKVYLDEFALTDAGGNTYLNLADLSSIGRIEVLKGPEGSIFGANTGGVVLVSQDNRENRGFSGGISAGSYGLFRENFGISTGKDNYHLSAGQAWQRSDGYRENSSLNRRYYTLSQRFKYRPSSELRSTVFFSDLGYRTPGGLTLAQASADPQAARPASGKLPGAEEQSAGVRNKTFFAGLLNESRLGAHFRLVAALSGMHTDFQNPFITNFEVRQENALTLRSFIAFQQNGSVGIDWSVGIEAQTTRSVIRNYGNRAGTRDTLQSADKLAASQDFVFTRLALILHPRLILEAAGSLNLYAYRYSSSFPIIQGTREKRFEDQLMPRFALSWTAPGDISLRTSLSRGYSAPTLAEVRASDNVINTGLQPEKGWNYEAGVRWTSKIIRLDASVFRFDLDHAIVRRLTAGDTEYFINSGGTHQLGVEFSGQAWALRPRAAGWLRSALLSAAATWSDFSFRRYADATATYSGNDLTGVPRRTVLSSLTAGFPGRLSLFAQHNYTSAIPLNDANSVYSRPFHVFQGRVGWSLPPPVVSHPDLQAFIGADNIFNAKYSLGNDLNAAGSRYYNPAPYRNYYLGITVKGI